MMVNQSQKAKNEGGVPFHIVGKNLPWQPSKSGSEPSTIRQQVLPPTHLLAISQKASVAARQENQALRKKKVTRPDE